MWYPEWVEWLIGVWKLGCGVRVGMFAGYPVFEEVVWRLRIESDDVDFWGLWVVLEIVCSFGMLRCV